MGDLVKYLIEFLLYGNTEAVSQVGYTDDESRWSQYRVVILPNAKLGKTIVYPDLSPLRTRQEGNTTVIEQDIVYTAFFFLSRAEELINDQRDAHNRFVAHLSILHRKNMLQMPLLDEYGHILLKMLNLPLPEPGFDHIYLTHDVDTLSFYRSLRSTLGGFSRGAFKQTLLAHRNLLLDPAFTFPWILDTDERLMHNAPCPVTQVYFLKKGPNIGRDYPQYRGRDQRTLLSLLKSHHANIGYHSAYDSNYLHSPEDMAGIINCNWHRAHYLRCSIERMQYLEELGYTDDFTMGFADAPGFRLQTTRAVRWINPYTYSVSGLTLHPLVLMDTTLSDERYLGLNEEEAWFACQQLIDRVRQNHGELVLLWHNSNFTRSYYHKTLYTKIIDSLCTTKNN